MAESVNQSRPRVYPPLASTTTTLSVVNAAAGTPFHGGTNVWPANSTYAAAPGTELAAPPSHTPVLIPIYAYNGQRGGWEPIPNWRLRVFTGPAYPDFAQPFIMSGQIIAPREALQFAPSVHLSVMSPIDRQLSDRILKQIEHYFSCDNLVKDLYLRSKMDDEGWVPINVIAGFKKVKEMTDNIRIILEAVKNSDVVQVEGEKIRKRHGWQIWLLPPSFDISGL